MDPIVTASASNRVIVLASQPRRGRGRVAWVPASASWIGARPATQCRPRGSVSVSARRGGQPARFGVIPMSTVSEWGVGAEVTQEDIALRDGCRDE